MPLSGPEFAAIWLTLRLAALTTVLLLLVGTPLAWWLARTRSRLKGPVGALVALPLVLPPTVLGFYLLVTLGPQGPVGRLTEALGLGTLAFTFSGLGLMIAARPKTIEAASGLMNLAMMPMWVFSGVFFNAANFPDVMQPFIQALPLTAVVDALRATMLEGASLAALGPEILIIGIWMVVSFAVALKIFRWQ